MRSFQKGVLVVPNLLRPPHAPTIHQQSLSPLSSLTRLDRRSQGRSGKRKDVRTTLDGERREPLTSGRPSSVQATVPGWLAGFVLLRVAVKSSSTQGQPWTVVDEPPDVALLRDAGGVGTVDGDEMPGRPDAAALLLPPLRSQGYVLARPSTITLALITLPG